MLNRVLGAFLLIACTVPTVAVAQERPIKLESEVKLVRLEQSGEAPELVEPEGVVPGDTLVFTTSYRNEGGTTVSDFVIVNPIPSDLVLTEESAAAADVSVDGGQTWGRLADLTVVENENEERPASTADITHMRWVISTVPPSEAGEVRFSARVR